MPMIELEDKDGNIRWITVLPFNDLSSSGGLRIVKKGEDPIYWVCNPEDAAWAKKCGCKEVK